MNEDKYCRVCMLERLDELDIFHDIFDNFDGKYCSYSESISYCTGLKVNQGDGLSSIICEPCINDLRIAHRFKDISIETDARLRTPKQKVLTYEFLPDYDDVEDFMSTNDREEIVKENIIDLITQKHKKKRRKKNLKHYRCTLCNIYFSHQYEEYKKHKIKFHVDDITSPSVCEVCGLFVSRGYRKHSQSHRPPLTLCCAHCPYKTTNKYLLSTHMNSMHFKTRSFQCEYCSATPTSLANLRAHIRRNHTNVRNYKCEQCDRAFCYKNELQQHLDFHMGIKRFHCNNCNKMYADLQDLKKHLLKVHEITTARTRSGPKLSNDIIGYDKYGSLLHVAKKI